MARLTKPFDQLHFSDLVLATLRARKLESLAILLCSCGAFAGTIFYPFFLKLMIDALAGFQLTGVLDWQRLGWLIVMGTCWWSCSNIPGTSAEVLLARPGVELRATLRQQMSSYVYDHAPQFFHERFAGSIGTNVRDISESVFEIYDDLLTKMLPAVIYLVCLCGVFLHLYIGYFFIFVAWGSFQIGVLWFTHETSKRKSNENAEAFSSLIGKLIDSFTNHIAVRSFAAKRQELSLLRMQEDELMIKRKGKIYFTRGITLAVGVIQPLFVFGGFLGLFLYLFAHGRATPGDFMFLMPSVGAMMFNIRNLTYLILDGYEKAGKGQNAMEKVLLPHQITDRAGAQDLRVIEAQLVVENVTFAYQANKTVLRDISFTMQGGEKIGVVGYSGAGKSTLVHLLMRFYEVTHGKIMIDGQDIRDVTQDSLRRAIAFIPQDINLFHRSLMDNIRVARPDATNDDVVEAAKRAGAHEFISVLDHGYDTLVGERGVKLSGGQRQRIAIARAFLQQAPILILDEATSALDSMTEHLIQTALDEVMQNRTTLVIAHRLSTLRQMNRILVFEQGQIIEQGTHDVLLALNGRYAQMWAMQAGGFLPERLATQAA